MSMDDTVHLSDISDDLKRLKTSVETLEHVVKRQSNALLQIHKMLESFGETLGPIIKAKTSEVTKNSKTNGPVSTQTKLHSKDASLSEAIERKRNNGIHAAKSFHSFPIQSDGEISLIPAVPEESSLTASKSTPALKGLLGDANVSDTNFRDKSRRASFSISRNSGEMKDKVRSRSADPVRSTETIIKHRKGATPLRKQASNNDGMHTGDMEVVDLVVKVPEKQFLSPEKRRGNNNEIQNDNTSSSCDFSLKNLDIIKAGDSVLRTTISINKPESSECNNTDNQALTESTECLIINSGALSTNDVRNNLENRDNRSEDADSKTIAPSAQQQTVCAKGIEMLKETQVKGSLDLLCGDCTVVDDSTKTNNAQLQKSGGVEKSLADKKPENIGPRPKDRVYSCANINSASSSESPPLNSNISADSAPPEFHAKMQFSESEDEPDEEIQISPMPHPAFAHRVVQIKSTNSKYFYDLKDQIGGGRFGRVYRCVERKSGLQLAAKCFKCKRPHEISGFRARSLNRPVTMSAKRTDQEPVDKDDVRHEISIMNGIDHENIVKLYDAFEHENTMTLILEYMGGGEMFERVLADRSQLTEFDAILYMRQINKAMQYLHKNLILHLDLKPENILCLDRTSHHIKIIDFGLARKHNPRQKLMIHWGTPEFMAPEVLNYEHVSTASDMWSIGVIAHILMSGISPFLGNDDKETIENIIDAEWDFEDEQFDFVSDDARDFISRLLVVEKRGRMSAAQCLRHEWLSKPLTTQRKRCLQSKRQLKKFMARTHWKAGMAAVTAANWLFNKTSPHEVKTSPNVKESSV